jgi:predicted regulator of Ras-like GTPase activity (Roadblock/LC7/MglB family)
MAVTGSLEDISLASLISINCNEMKHASLRVNHQGQKAALFFEDGNVVHATLGSQEGQEAVYELLTWDEGEFELEHDIAVPRHTITSGWSGLVLEGMRRIDERAAGASEALMQGEEPDGHMGLEGMVRRLRSAEGVAGVVVVARDGIVLAYDLNNGTAGDTTEHGDANQPDREGAIAVFVGNAASQIGDALGFGTFVSGVVETASAQTKTLVLNQPDYYVGVLLAERASPALVATRLTALFQ